MRQLVFLLLFLVSGSVFAVDKSKYTPEQLFVIGTELFRAERKEFDPNLGLEFLLESAKFKYEFAPFGLCVALSTEKPILDLQEAYTWCYIAEKIDNKYSNMASQRSDGILGKILLDSGISGVDKAKKLAIAKYQE
ncbi:hypothetical protein NBRC116595_41910 [Aliiglaciecola sp. NS0011-25]